MVKKYGALICEDAAKWGTPEELGNKFINVFKSQDLNEQWEYFSVFNGELPDINKLDQYQGFLISGSHYSANDTYDWITKLENVIKACYERHERGYKTPKLFGMCFGHQIIGKALGAKVVKNRGGRFIFKQVEIKPTAEFQNFTFYQAVLGSRQNIVLFQSHGEEIIELPKCGRLLASSECCENEVVHYGDNIISFQGHMEISEKEMLQNILPAIKNARLFNKEEEKEMWDSIANNNNDRFVVVHLVKNFLS